MDWIWIWIGLIQIHAALISRRANCKFRPQFVASSKLAQIRRMCLEYHSKTEFKGKHSQKLPEELIHAVVSLLLVLTDPCDVFIQIFFAEYLLCNNYLLKSKISRQSVKQYGTDSPLKNVIFSGPLLCKVPHLEMSVCLCVLRPLFQLG